MMPIACVSFDLWDTVFIDDSDEPHRAALGLATKAQTRRDLVLRFLRAHGDIERRSVELAYDTVDAAFRAVWYGQSVTWTVRERLEILLSGLGRTLPDDELRELTRLHEDMEVEVKPELAPGVADAIADVANRYRLAVVSDAIFSPGRALRQILDHYGLLKYFSAFAFSDELGRSKPHRRCFESVAEQVGCSVQHIVHLGDRGAKDIDGPVAVGARGVLIRVVKDRGADARERSAAVCDRFEELPSILERLDAGC